MEKDFEKITTFIKMFMPTEDSDVLEGVHAIRRVIMKCNNYEKLLNDIQEEIKYATDTDSVTLAKITKLINEVVKNG